tara:strand:- start:87 stop:1295 length:1209 start_codon:yes stop_codon:yes gene_type:complete
MRRVGKYSKVKQAVIFCGGAGSRLGSITKKVPKPLIRVIDKPFLENIIFQYSRFGVEEVVLLCSYKKELFFKKYHKKKLFNCKIFCMYEGAQKGRVLALKNAENKLNNIFFLSNGDTLLDFNLLDLKENFLKKKLINIGLIKKKTKNKTSKLNLNKFNNVEFSNTNGKFINTGYFLVKKKLLKYIKSKDLNLSFEEDFISSLNKNLVSGVDLKAKNFIDIGIPQTLAEAKKILKKFYNKSAIFLDRDGVINEDKGYVYKYKDINYINNIFEAVRFANHKNFYVFVISNQSGIGRGYYSKQDVNLLNSKILEDFRKRKANIDEMIYAPYYKNSKHKFTMRDKKMRKPETGMIDYLFKKWPIIKSNSIIVGDQDTDKLLAKKTRLKFIFMKKKSDLYLKLKKII